MPAISLQKKISFVLVATLATLVGLYPVIYFIIDEKFALLNSKSDELLNNYIWRSGFYTHIVAGGIALLIGWVQFSNKIRAGNVSLHRNLGRVYVFTALASSVSALYIGVYATGGIVPAAGFIALGVFWFLFTLLAFREILNGNIQKHRSLMFYSYACCFGAVMLRIYLPFLLMIFPGFNTAYSIVAWLSWVPNLFFVKYVLLKKKVKIV